MNTLKPVVFEFDTEFETGKALPVPIIRIHLNSGQVMRAWFGPEGLIVVAPKSSKENGDIIWADDAPTSFGSLRGD